MPDKYVNGFQQDDQVVLLYRDAAGTLRQRRHRAEHVSYHRTSEIKPHAAQLRNARAIRAYVEEGEWTRIVWADWDSRRKVCSLDPDTPLSRAGIKHYEADVSPLRRHIVDRAVDIAKPRRAFFDIETDSRLPFSEKEKMRIVCWTIVDGETGEVTTGILEADTDEAERALLEHLWCVLQPYDQLLAWFGDGFDFPVLEARSRLLLKREVVERDLRRMLMLDHLALFKRMNLNAAESGDEKQSMRLQDVGMAIVGEGKDDFDASKTWQAWAAGGAERERMVKYNRQDTVLLRKIEEKTGYVELFQTLCEVCRVFPHSFSLKPMAQVDSYMLRLGIEHGVHFATRWHDGHDDEEFQKFAGAYVMEPAKGIQRSVHVGDFKSMYPNIIVTWNMSPETKRYVAPGALPADTCRAPSTQVAFRTDVKGMLPLAVETLMGMRDSWKKKKASFPPGTPEAQEANRRSMAYKVAANSFYGVVGSPFSRYYDREVSESITQQGVWLIQRVIELAEREGMSAKYADTDSLFITGASRQEFGDFIKRVNSDLLPRLVGETGAPSNTNAIAYEKAFDILVMCGKKRYAGNYIHYDGKDATKDSKPEVKGLEYKRGDTTAIARAMQYVVINAILAGGEGLEASTHEPTLEHYLKQVLEGELPVEHVRVSKTLGKDLGEYVQKNKADGSPAAMLPHLNVAKELLACDAVATVRRFREVADQNGKRRKEAYQDVPAGTRIEYVVVDASSTPLKAIPAAEYKGECDRYYLWENLVWPPTERVLESAFPAHDWKRFSKVRPRKVRARKVKGEGQLSLDLGRTATRVAVVQLPDGALDDPF